jgi:hypothetical protein
VTGSVFILKVNFMSGASGEGADGRNFAAFCGELAATASTPQKNVRLPRGPLDLDLFGG